VGCSDRNNTAIHIGEESRTNFARDLAGGERSEVSDADTGVIFESGLVSLRESERCRLILSSKFEDEDEEENEDEWETSNIEI
jgi:hypothetical protein